jgi:hypothetical protein
MSSGAFAPHHPCSRQRCQQYSHESPELHSDSTDTGSALVSGFFAARLRQELGDSLFWKRRRTVFAEGARFEGQNLLSAIGRRRFMREPTFSEASQMEPARMPIPGKR